MNLMPNPYAAFRSRLICEDAGDGLFVVTLDTGASQGALAPSLLDELAQVLEHLLALGSSLKGWVLRGRGEFSLGRTDLQALADSNESERRAMGARFARLSRHMRQLERKAPSVAVLEGLGLGQGLELALACHHRLADVRAPLALGLPDIAWGCLPSLGGVARSVRMLGFERAYTRLLRSGQVLSGEDAQSLGLVVLVDTAPGGEGLMNGALQWLRENPGHVQTWDQRGWAAPDGGPSAPQHAFKLHAWPAQLRLADAELEHQPAPLALLSATVECAWVQSLDAALAVEARHASRVLAHPTTGHLLRTRFVHLQAARGADAWRMDAPSVARALHDTLKAHADSGWQQAVREAVQGDMQAARSSGVPGASLKQALLGSGLAVPAPEWPAPTHGNERGLFQAPVELGQLEHRLLHRAAQALVKLAGSLPNDEQDLVSIWQAGFPAWSGGAASYLREGRGNP